MIPAVIVCHGGLGEAYLQALAAIYGDIPGLSAVSNEGLSGPALERAVAERLKGFGEGGIVFTDYFGGSCASACLALLPERSDLRIASGVNLPMLLYYLAHRHELGVDELLQGILHRGQNAIRELKPPGL
jgi:mannose/fructose-specific phosphotransferase system component IIA